MKVKDMFEKGFDMDVDVYDNVCEELAIAYCGEKLTGEGKKHFAEVLEYDIEFFGSERCPVVVVDVDGEEGEWQKKLAKAKELFYGAAGYCTVKEYDKWFKEDE